MGVLRLVSCVELVAAVCKEAAANIELILREAICTRMNVARYQGIKRRIKEDGREQRHLLAAESMVVLLDDVKTVTALRVTVDGVHVKDTGVIKSGVLLPYHCHSVTRMSETR